MHARVLYYACVYTEPAGWSGRLRELPCIKLQPHPSLPKGDEYISGKKGDCPPSPSPTYLNLWHFILIYLIPPNLYFPFAPSPKSLFPLRWTNSRGKGSFTPPPLKPLSCLNHIHNLTHFPPNIAPPLLEFHCFKDRIHENHAKSWHLHDLSWCKITFLACNYFLVQRKYV